MNSSNDSLDKRLRQRFQQLFAHEQVPVDDALKQRIWDQLPTPPPRTHRWAGLVGLVVLLCLSIGLYYGVISTSPPASRIYSPNNASTNSRLTQPAAKGRALVAEPTNTYATKTTTQSSPAPVHQEGSAPNGPTVSLVTDPLPTNPTHKANNKQPSDYRTITNTDNQTELRTAKRHSIRHSPGSIARSGGRLVTMTEPHRKAIRWPSHMQRINSLQTTTSLKHNALADAPITLSVVPRLNVSRRGWSLASGLSSRITRQIDSLTPEIVSKPPFTARPTAAVQWFLMAAPVSTYQQMTIIARTNTYLQDVTSPAPWSAQTWSYQLSGGIRWQGWETSLSYWQLRRWAYYERATDAYVVEPVSPSTYQVRRRTEEVSENVSLSVLGAGISRAYEWGKHHRYYSRAGAQLTYVLPTHQTLGWLQASWGLTLPLGKHQVQVGPLVAYSLSDWWSRDGQLRIQPYTAGFSLTVRP